MKRNCLTVFLFFRSQWNEIEALSDVNIMKDNFNCIGVMGTNGAGKSTLIKMMTGISHPSSGSIKILEHVSVDILGSNENSNLNINGNHLK